MAFVHSALAFLSPTSPVRACLGLGGGMTAQPDRAKSAEHRIVRKLRLCLVLFSKNFGNRILAFRSTK